MKYRVYDATIQSDIHFPQLVQAQDDAEPDYYITVGQLPDVVIADIRQKGGPSGKGEGFYWLNTPGGHFAIWQENTIIASPEGEDENESIERMRTYLLGYGLSLLFYGKGAMAVHCSAVCVGEDCILLAGKSGAGKSTLAGAFLDRGAKLMADDVAMLQKTDREAFTYPAFPVRKLCRDAAERGGYDLTDLTYIDEDKDKFAVDARSQFAEHGAAVRAMFIVTPEDGAGIRAQEVTGQDKIELFVDNLFLHAMLSRDGMDPVMFFKCLEILSVLPVYKLYRPTGKEDTTDQLVHCVKEILGVNMK